MANANNQLNVRVTGEDDLSPILNQLESRVIRTVGAISAALAGIKLVAAPITIAGDFERELANVQKTTGFTQTKIDQLSKSLLDLSLRIDVSTLDLAKIAAAAGQQGLGRHGVEGVVQFTDSVARMASVLDVTAEDAGTAMGKLQNIFDLPASEIENMVSSFNEVANNSTATGEELLDVVKRIGDAARSIDLKDAVGIAATGLDMGINPEVVGTAMTTFFSNMRAKADQFAKLTANTLDDDLTDTTEKWLKLVETDGVGAFKRVLTALRQLNSADQQLNIVKLLGGGRQGGFITKLIQDTTDATLNRNLGFSDKGYTSGTSALKEQATVLNTLNGQAQLLVNTLFKIGDTVGDDTVGPLTALVVQLRQALDSDGFRSFANIVGQSLADMINFFRDAGSYLGGLNINWENFVKVAKVFVSIKLAELLGAIFLRLPGISAGMKSIAGASNEAAAAMTKAGAAAAALNTATAPQSWAARIASMSEFGRTILATVAAFKQARDARREQAQLEDELARKQAAAAALIPSTARAQNVAATGNFSLSAAQQNHAAAQKAQLEAVQTNALKIQALIDARDASLAKKTEEHNAKVATIEATYQGRRGKQAQAALAAELAAEEASYARRLRATEAYHAKRIETARNAGLAEVAAMNAALVAAEQTLEKVQGQTAGKRANADAARSALEAANLEVAATKTRLDAATAAATTARSAIFTLSGAIGVLGRALSGLARIAAGAFFWVTVVYSIADALGLIEKLAGPLQTVTDWLGLTSKAQRDARVESEKATQALKDQERALRDIAKEYERYKNALTGRVEMDTFTSIEDRIRTAGNQRERTGALDDLNAIMVGASAAQSVAAGVASDSVKQLDEAKKKVIDYNAEVARLRKMLANPDKATAIVGYDGVERLQGQLKTAEDAAQKAQERVNRLSTAISDVDPAAKNAAEALSMADQTLAKLFTPQTAGLVDQYVVKLVAAREKLEPLRAEIDKTRDAMAAVGTKQGPIFEEAEARFNAALDAYEQQNRIMTATQAQLNGIITSLRSMPNVPEATLGSLRVLEDLAKRSEAQVSAVANRLSMMASAGLPFTGELAAPFNTPAATGDKESKPSRAGAGGDGKGYARRLAQARLALAQAEARAQRDFETATLESQQRREDEAFARGLRALQNYHEGRKRLNDQLLDAEIAAKREELAQVEQNIKQAENEAERIRYRAEKVKLESAIRTMDTVTRADRRAAEDEALRAAIEQQQDEFRRLGNDLARDLFPAPTAAQLDLYKSFYDEIAATNRVTMARIEAEITAAYARGADSAAKDFERLREALERMQQERAVEQMMNRIKTQSDLAADSIDRFYSRLNQMATLGMISGGQMETAFATLLDQAGPQLAAAIAQGEAEMARLGDTTSATYQRMAAEVEQMKLRLVDLQLTANHTAISMNKSIEDALADGLTNLEFSFDSLRTTALQVLLDIANAMKQALAREIAQQFMIGLTGGNGTEGPGGWFQSLFRDKTAQQTANGIVNSNATLGTNGNPMWVRLASGAQLGQGMAGAAGGILPTLSGIFTGKGGATYDLNPGGVWNGFGTRDDSVKLDTGLNLSGTKGLFADMVPQVEEMGTGLLGTLSSGFKSVFGSSKGEGFFGGLGSMLSGLTDTIGGFLSGLFGGGSAGGGGGMGAFGGFAGGWLGVGLGVAGLIAQVAQHHSGGVVGSGGARRMVDPSLFANAARFHSGGLPGLQSNEVAAILEKGEEVVTRDDPRNVLNGGKSGQGAMLGGDGQVPAFFLIDDRTRIPELMSTREGQKAIMVTLRQNAAALKQIVKG